MTRALVLALFVWSSLGAASAWPRPEQGDPLPAIRVNAPSGEVTINRIRLRCPAGSCVVFQKTGRLMRASTTHFARLPDWLRANGGNVLRDPVWNGRAADQEFADGDEGDVRFNGHTFVLSVVGLTPADWVQGIAHEVTDNENPMDIFLRSYFDLKHTFPAATTRVEQTEVHTGLSEGDILTFTATNDGGKLHHKFSGRLKRRNDKWWITWKLGEAYPVVETPLSAPVSMYGGFDEVRVYRLKPRP